VFDRSMFGISHPNRNFFQLEFYNRILVVVAVMNSRCVLKNHYSL
jgi:hypothetical protein